MVLINIIVDQMFINKSKAIKEYTNTERSSSLSKNSYQAVYFLLLDKNF